MKHQRTFGRLCLFALLVSTAFGCVYYNTFYNALKRYQEAEQKRYEAEARPDSRQATQTYQALYMSAIRKASVVLDRHAKSKWVDDSLLLIGKAFYWRRQYNEALLKFQELQENFPQSKLIEESLYWQGLALWASERTDEARGILEIVAGMSNPTFSPKAQLALAELEGGEGDYEAATEAYHHLLSQTKQKKLRAEIWQGLGNAYFQLKNYDEALQAYNKVLGSSPDPTTNYQTRLQIGRALERQGRLEEAMQIYEKTLTIKRFRSYVPDIRLKQANVYNLMGRVEEALEAYQEIIQNNPRTEYGAQAYYQMGLIEQKQQKDLIRAKELFEEARRQKGASNVSLLARDQLTILADLDRYQKAAENAGLENPEPYFNLAELYLFKLAEPDSALAIYQKVLGASDTTEYAPKALYAIGLVYADSLKNEAAAHETFQTLIDTHPISPYAIKARERIRHERTDDVLAQARFLEAEALKREGMAVEDVLTILKQVAEEYPKSLFAPKALYTLAWTYENQLHSLDTARVHYQFLVDQYPLTEFAEVARDKLEGGFLDLTPTNGADSVGIASAESTVPDDTLQDTPPASSADIDAGQEEPSPEEEERGPVDFWKVETKPVLIKHVDAEYPDAARHMEVEGEVVLKFQIGTDGWIGEVEVLKGDDTFTQAATDAIRQFIFEPAMQNNQPVPVWAIQSVTFKLPDRGEEVEEDLVDFWKVEKQPVLIEQVDPEYPEQALQEGLEGDVLIKFKVEKNGQVGELRVLDGEKIFTQAALEAIRQFIFEPAMQDNRPVRVWVPWSIKFKLPY